ncbi:MoaD/ThiS family protein [Pseudonocardiaceae bacterium YIM PH 21723]|nr:MoaD/ThiS family protein [Pseudonocardiaceae bacterium YIM PH 21723]
MTSITIRYFAGARAAAGRPEEQVLISTGTTVAELLISAGSRHGERLERALSGCSYLVDGVAVRDRTMPLTDGAVLDVLPPFAGG